jgi:type I restriction enzyme M protein
MPLTPKMRQDLWDIENYLFGGGYPDPVSNAEQLSFLFFFYLVEGIDAENALKAKVLKLPYEPLFAGEWVLKNPLNAIDGKPTIPRDRFRWSVWAKALTGESMVRFVRDEVFPFYAEMGEQAAHNFMEGARLSIIEPTVLTQIVGKVDELRLDQADADTKGDLFENMLRRIKQAGSLGQFRTPRHIIRAIVEMIDPKVGETVYDPAAGTAGFLVAAYNHMRLANSSPTAIQEVEIDGKTQTRGLGDKLSAAQVSALQTATFYGNDVDPKMVRLATMNLTLRGLPNVRILLRNVLTTTLDNERKRELSLPQEGYHVVLANPPFSGRVNKDRIVDDVKVGTTTATELLFLKYMLDSLRVGDPRSGAGGGRCGVIVPEGVLFGSTGSHKELRRQLIENNRVEAVLSLPGGVFQPYSGVKTSVLLFRKGGTTDKVLFLHADNDGYKLDANHDTPIEADDLPGLVSTYQHRDAYWFQWLARFSPLPPGEPSEGPGVREAPASYQVDLKAAPPSRHSGEGRNPAVTTWTPPSSGVTAEPWPHNWWFADVATLRANDFNLSAGRYRPMSNTAVEHRDPRELLDELAAIEVEIAEEVEALRVALAEIA